MAAVKPKQKKATPKKKTAADKSLKVKKLPDGAVFDFSELGIDDLKLTATESRYVFWYCNPDYDTFQNKTRAAIKAGYSPDSARWSAYELHAKPRIVEAIRRLMDPLKIDVKEEFEHIIRTRIARIHYNVADYYKKITITEQDPETKELVENEIEVLKDLSELTSQQLLALDGIDYKGMAGRKVFIFADREKSMIEMMNLYNKLFGGPANNNNDDGEATMEIIRERLTVKMTARKGKDAISQIAGFIEDSSGGDIAQEL
jgi:hypothetical protein